MPRCCLCPWTVSAPALPTLHPFYAGTYHFLLASTHHLYHRACFGVQVLVHWQQTRRQQRGSDCNKSHKDAEFKRLKVCHLFSVIIMQIQTPKTYTSAWCRSYHPYPGQPGTNLPISTNYIIYFLSKSSFCLYFTVLFMLMLYLAFGIIRGFNPTSI